MVGVEENNNEVLKDQRRQRRESEKKKRQRKTSAIKAFKTGCLCIWIQKLWMQETLSVRAFLLIARKEVKKTRQLRKKESKERETNV